MKDSITCLAYYTIHLRFAAKQVTIQAVVDNLQISCLEYRDENDPDVSQYTHHRKLELVQVFDSYNCSGRK